MICQLKKLFLVVKPLFLKSNLFPMKYILLTILTIGVAATATYSQADSANFFFQKALTENLKTF